MEERGPSGGSRKSPEEKKTSGAQKASDSVEDLRSQGPGGAEEPDSRNLVSQGEDAGEHLQEAEVEASGTDGDGAGKSSRFLKGLKVKGKNGRKNRKVFAVFAVLLLIGVAVVAQSISKKAKETAEATEKAVPVEVAVAAKGDISEVVSFTGRIYANYEVSVIPKVSGQIEEIYVDVGDIVSKGKALAKIDDDHIATQVRQAEAALAAARSSEEQARLELERAAAALSQAEESFQIAKNNYERGKFLLEQGAISQAEFESNFQSPYINAKSGWEQAQAAYEMSRKNLEEIVPSQIEQAEAALEAARLQLENTVVTAPFSGMVSARFADPGDMASTSQPLLTLVELDQVKLKVNVTEDDVNKITVGQEVEVFVEAAGERPFKGKIVTIAPAADSRSKLYPVEILLSNKDHLLKPGMFARVNITTETRKNVLRIPVEAVLEEDGQKIVYIIKDGCACRRVIKTGLTGSSYVEVLEGLRPGDQVVVTGQEFLIDGTAVTVVKSEGGAK